jgi:hypothetical protein
MVDLPRSRARQLLTACLVLVGPLLCAGCVERRYTLRTDPPGALAIVNGEEIGQTPVSRSFYYYGDREITFILDGYETRTVIQPMKAPWWDNMFTEFFTENLVPFTLRDEREFRYQLMPATSPVAADLRDRAEQLRAGSQVPPPPRRGGLLGWLGFDCGLHPRRPGEFRTNAAESASDSSRWIDPEESPSLPNLDQFLMTGPVA